MLRKSLLRRLGSGAIALALIASLTACGSSSSSDSSSSDETAESTEETSEETAEEETAEASSESSDEIYNVVVEWVSIGNTPTEENLQKIEDAVNEITVDAIGCTITLYPVEISDLANSTTLAVSTGEKIDLVVTVGTGVGDYVDQGLIIPMDDYLEEYGTDLSERLGESLLDGYYDGELYGVPNAYISAESFGFVARTDLLEKYGIEIDEDALYTFDDLTEIFEIISEGEGEGFYCVGGNTSSSDIFTSYVGMVDTMGATTSSGGLLLRNGFDNTTIENIYASDEYAEYAETMYEWAQAGYIPGDASSNTEDIAVQIMAGNYLGGFYWTTPGAAEGVETSTGYEMTSITMTVPYRASTNGVLWSIPITSENPQKAFEFLNLLYADNDIDTTLMYGLEGETFQIIEEDENGNVLIDFVDGIDSTSAPFYCYAGIYGDRLSWYIWEPNSITMNDELREFNDSIENSSPAFGYRFVITDEVSSKYSAVTAVVEQYAPIFSSGAVDPSTGLETFISALEDAGINDVIAENQAQLDAWLAEQ